MSVAGPLTRRNFLGLVGAGVGIFIGVEPAGADAQEHRSPYPADLNAYLRIGGDGRVTVFSGKVEMGQGVMTSQAQMLAEELGVDLDAIDMVLGDTERCPWDMGTFGSLTTRMFGPALRAAGAEARAVLLGLAATKLGVPRERLIVQSGSVRVNDDPRRCVSYAELAKGQKIARLVNEKAILTAATGFHLIGASPQRLDAREKVTGAAKFAADVRLPGMLYARIVRPPAHGARLMHADTSDPMRAGLQVIRRDELIAVLHTDPESAAAAVAHIKADWSPAAEASAGPALDPETIFEHLVRSAPALADGANRGNLGAGFSQSAQRFESTFKKGYVAHAPIEPHAAVADVTPSKATVWASTQTPFPTRDRIAHALGRDPGSVRVITPYLGGGFGGKSADQQALEAALLSQLAGKPVQVAWDRAEEFFFDRFDPAAVVKISAGLSADGRIVAWDFAGFAAGERGSSHLYDIPNLRIRTAGGPLYTPPTAPGVPGPKQHPFDVGPWRAPGANMNVFAIESQMDILAAAAALDPLEFRLRHLTDPRMRRVLNAAEVSFGWFGRSKSAGHGFGLACSTDAGSYVATMAEVHVDRSNGRVQALRVTCAEDLGTVVNPDGARMQIEGAVTMGLGYSLTEQLNFSGGKILDRNFSSYHLPRFSMLPRIEAVLVPNSDVAPQGGGEPPITTMGAVLANAVCDATGARLYRLPMSPERVLAALEA